MKWTAYLRDQCLPIVVWALAIGFVVMMLGTLGVNASARVFLAIVLAAAGVVCLLYGYFRRAGFYRDLKDRMESLDQKYLITEMIERPEFLEGKLLYDLLNQVDKFHEWTNLGNTAALPANTGNILRHGYTK